MTILSDRSILSLINPQGETLIDPFASRTVYRGMSYGLSSAGYDIRIKDTAEVPPQSYVLGTTVEHFSFPLNVMGMLADKSSWARRGIAVQNTIFEPGWRGYATLEISNHGRTPIIIEAGMPIGQMIFYWVDAETGGYKGKYQDQPQRPVMAINEGENEGSST